MYLVNPEPPHNATGEKGLLSCRANPCVLTFVLTVILDNFFGRQFNSLNDASINPRNGEIYFTDPTYGYVQDFRPPPVLPKQVWRFNEATGAVAIAADGFNMPNGKRDREIATQNPSSYWLAGISFSPNGAHLYVADTGMAQGFFGTNHSFPSTMQVFLPFHASDQTLGFAHHREILTTRAIATATTSTRMAPWTTARPLRL